MNIYYQDNHVALYHGDCLDVLAAMPDNSVDSIVTDPPYGLGFMGRKWDALPPSLEWAEACYRVLKPGGHIVAFGGTRTWHRLAVAIEDAGFEMRDSLAWLYGSGFPKSMDVSKAIDKQKHKKDDTLRFTLWLREQCELLGISKNDLDKAAGTSDMGGWWTSNLPHRCAIPTAEQWESIARFFPALPDWAVPLIAPANQPGEAWEKREVVGHAKGAQAESTGRYGAWGNDRGDGISEYNLTAPATSEAVQWDGWGTALKPAFEPIVLARKPFPGTVARNVLEHGTGAINVDACRIGTEGGSSIPGGMNSFNASNASHGYRASAYQTDIPEAPAPSGRWPANVLLDEHAAAWVDEQSGHLPAGNRPSARNADKVRAVYGKFAGQDGLIGGRMDSGGASRFFYTAKAPKSERPNVDGIQHPTVKPLAIMRWLIRLVTPPGGTVLDPFAGSGTTIEAAMMEGFHPVGIEKETDYLPLITARITRAKTSAQGVLDLGGIA